MRVVGPPEVLGNLIIRILPLRIYRRRLRVREKEWQCGEHLDQRRVLDIDGEVSMEIIEAGGNMNGLIQCQILPRENRKKIQAHHNEQQRTD